MQLRFLRFCLIISLLRINQAKHQINSQDNQEMNHKLNSFESSEYSQNLLLPKHKYSNAKDSRHSRTYKKAILSNPKLSQSQILAEKLAKEIERKSKRKPSMVRAIKTIIGYYKPSLEHLKRKKRKRYKRDLKPPSIIRQEKTIRKRQAENPSLQLKRSSDDFRNHKKVTVRESMLERVMKTTTKDPKKKNSGDQGIEYSEYYNDADVVNDPPVSKIQKKKNDDSKSSIFRFQRQVTNDKLNDNNFQQDFDLKQDDELNDEFLEDEENAADGNESDLLFSDLNQNQVYQKKNIQQRNLVNQQNKGYQQNSYFIPNQVNPNDYGMLAQQVGFNPYPQFFYPNQHINQFKNPNQIFSPFHLPGNQIPVQNINLNNGGSNYNRNQTLLSAGEPQQYNNNFEMITTTLSSRTASNKSYSINNTSVTNRIINNVTFSTPYLQSQSQVSRKQFSGTPGAESSKKRSDETLSMKYNLNPINSLLSSINQGRDVSYVDQNQLNLNVSASETQVIANQILSKIVDELEEIKAATSKKSEKEGRPCRISGSWVTSKAGVKLTMNVVNHSIIVTTEKLERSPTFEGFLNTTWNLTGHAPFKHGGPFFLSGVNDKAKSLAVFVGSCKVCQGIDTIEGIWTVSQESRDCRDLLMATGIHNDIFRRKRIHNAKSKIHQQNLKATKSTILSSASTSATKFYNKLPYKN